MNTINLSKGNVSDMYYLTIFSVCLHFSRVFCVFFFCSTNFAFVTLLVILRTKLKWNQSVYKMFFLFHDIIYIHTFEKYTKEILKCTHLLSSVDEL